MKVLQLIDSLEPGGAERMAVNLANGLVSRIESSFLCTTRKEGILKDEIFKEVNYLFLEKNSSLDLKAIKELSCYIKKNDVSIIHAHASSFFIATIIKVLNPKTTLIWHEHYGNREQTSVINKFILKICSYFFSCIITVNKALSEWSDKKLLAKKVCVLENYPVMSTSSKTTILYGEPSKRIVCLANLRPDKDHLTLLIAFSEVVKTNPNWTLHCIGKDLYDAYSISIKEKIKVLGLSDSIFLYDTKSDISNILAQSSIGTLSSKSEGLPIALLEYGISGLPVVVTDVGDCKDVVLDNVCGFVVPKENHKELAKKISQLIMDEEKAKKFGQQLKIKVQQEYSETKYIENLIDLYSAL